MTEKTYTTKPIEVKALQISIENANDIMRFTDNQVTYADGFWGWKNDNFSRQFRDGDYVCKYNNGQLFLIEKDRFEKDYVEKN